MSLRDDSMSWGGLSQALETHLSQALETHPEARGAESGVIHLSQALETHLSQAIETHLSPGPSRGTPAG